MKINLAQLKEGTHEFNSKNKPAEIGLNINIFPDAVCTKITVDKRGQNYYLKFLSKANSRFSCDRCLETCEKEIIAKSKLIYTHDDTLINDSGNDEIRYIPIDKDNVDISDHIKQFIILSLPIKRLCRENCKGLCPHCGNNINNNECECKSGYTDPRWEKLKDINS